MSVRIDKFTWFVRIAKTRSVATDLVQKGKVKLNGLQVKPSREVKIGDVIQIIRNTAIFEYKILQLLDKRVGAKLVAEYLLDITSPVQLERYHNYRMAQEGYRQYGTGRPDKHDRKDINDFLNNDDYWEED